MLAPVAPLGDHHRAVPYAGHPQQGVLDLADLDPEAADLHLGVPAAEELQFPVGQPAAVVAAAVQPSARPVRIVQEGECGPLGVVDVAAAHAHPGEHDLAGSAQGDGAEVFVHDVHVHVGDRPAERHPLLRRYPVHHLVVGVVRGLRQPIGVDQRDVRLGGEPALGELLLQRLPGDRHAAQVGQGPRPPLQARQHHLQVRGHHLEHRDPALDDPVDEAFRVQDDVLLHQERPAAHQQRRDQLPQGDVEALRRDLRHHRRLGDPQVVDLRPQVVEHAGVLAHRALGRARGTGGEVDVGQLVGGHRHAQVAAVRLLGQGRVHVQDGGPGQRGHCRLQGGRAVRRGQHQPAPCALQHGRDASGREVRLDRQVHPAGLEHRQHRGQPLRGALRDHRHGVLTAQPAGEQGPAQPVGPLIHLLVRPAARAVHHRHRLRMHPHPLLEQLVRPTVRQVTPGSGQLLQLEVQLLRREQALRMVRGVGVGCQLGERRAVVAGDPAG